jgi:hypothetical protein
MDLDIDSLIICPGMFVVSPDKRYRVTGQEEPEGTKLDIFKDKELAHSVYQAYAMCHNNAVARKCLRKCEFLRRLLYDYCTDTTSAL